MAAFEKDDILRKVKALFARADNPVNSHEAAACAAKAQEILLKHKLDLADLEDKDAASTFGIFEEDLNYPKGIREVPNWKRYLAAIVARNHFCHLFSTPRGLRFVGAEEDIAFVGWLYGYLDSTIERLSEAAWIQEKIKIERESKRIWLGFEDTKPPVNKREGVTWKNQFRFGVALVIDERLKLKRREMEAEAIRDRRENLRKEADAAWRNGKNFGSSIARLGESWEQSEERALQSFRQSEQRLKNYLDKFYKDVPKDKPVTMRGAKSADPFVKGMLVGKKIGLNRPIGASKQASPRNLLE